MSLLFYFIADSGRNPLFVLGKNWFAFFTYFL